MTDPLEVARRTIENAAWKPTTWVKADIKEFARRNNQNRDAAPLIAQALLDATEEIGRLREALLPFKEQADREFAHLERAGCELGPDNERAIYATIGELKAVQAALGDKP